MEVHEGCRAISMADPGHLDTLGLGGRHDHVNAACPLPEVPDVDQRRLDAEPIAKVRGGLMERKA